jgi:hypothetical protein
MAATPARRTRPRRGAAAEPLVAALCGGLWLASVVSLVLVAAGHGVGGGEDAAGWFFQSVFTVLAAPALWFWWRHILDQRRHDEPRPPELDEPSGPHLGLSGQVPPPKRW